MTQNTKKLQSYTIYFNPRTGLKSRVRTNPDDLCFDSLGEFELWKWLKQNLPPTINIDIHKNCESIAGIDWKIDFKINAHTKHSKNLINYLAHYLNPLPNKDLSDLEYLFIEYKGILDDNYVKKQKLISARDIWLDSRIIVISKQPTALIIEDLTLYTTFIKVIHSQDYFKGLVKQWLQQ